VTPSISKRDESVHTSVVFDENASTDERGGQEMSARIITDVTRITPIRRSLE